MEEALTFEHGIFLCIAHRNRRRIWLPLLSADGRLHVTELALVDHLILFTPPAVKEFATDQSLLFHI